jgi:hypothetical protein
MANEGYLFGSKATGFKLATYFHVEPTLRTCGRVDVYLHFHTWYRCMYTNLPLPDSKNSTYSSANCQPTSFLYWDTTPSWRQSNIMFKYFLARSQNCEMWLLASSCLSVLLSVRMEQLGSNWMDFYEIWYLSIFSKTCRENSSFNKIWQA